MSHTHHFHFTIGPVQGFVAQARRTRDFWAGSFILSWLTGVAMNATRAQGGEFIFPKPDEVFLDAIAGKGNNKPTQGTLPNRFKAGVDANFNGKVVVDAVQQAWQALADVVYDADLKAHANASTKAIWDRQVAKFFELSWAISESSNTLPVIDLRKNWRTHYPAAEAGHKCSLMEGWQELSGINGYHKQDNDARKAFWGKISNHIGTRDLVDNEHLCALAFIKRRFAHHFHKVQGTYKGWQLNPNNVPSVALLAAEPSIVQLGNNLAKCGYAQYQAFLNAWKACDGEFGKKQSLTESIRDAENEAAPNLCFDGIAWFSNTYDNPSGYGLNKDKAREAQKALKALYDATNVREPAPFYAILMMDGDSLGKQMSNSDLQPKITQGLNTFTKQVKGIVDKKNGFLIYAGGDDVLAILPIDSALDCAKTLRDAYIASFDAEMVTSISAAVIFAHVKTALSSVLHQAHHVLDDAAKDGAGRDAIAVQVIKNSGKHLLWAMPWQKALNEQGDLVVQTLAKQLRGQLTDDGFYNPENLEASTKFFYGIREHFTRLVDPKQPFKPETAELMRDLLAVDYKQSGVSKVKTIEEAKSKIEPLLTQCTPHKRMQEVAIKNLNSASIETIGAPQLDGALLVRFLAFKGQDRA